jgi:hypothetical protein
MGDADEGNGRRDDFADRLPDRGVVHVTDDVKVGQA